MIEMWLLSLQEKGLSNVSANHNLKALRTMLNEAERLGTLKTSPIHVVKPLRNDSKVKGVLTPPEVKQLFTGDALSRLWEDSLLKYTGNLLAAVSGLRLGEIQGLQADDVYPEYIHVQHSLERKYGLKETKTKQKRDIPIPGVVSDCLQELKQVNRSGFLFSLTGGENPVFYHLFTKSLYKALAGIGVDEEKRQERNITFHSWRHFFNSTLRAGGIQDTKIQGVTGHRTQAMTDHYIHYRVEDYQDIKTIQEGIL